MSRICFLIVWRHLFVAVVTTLQLPSSSSVEPFRFLAMMMFLSVVIVCATGCATEFVGSRTS